MGVDARALLVVRSYDAPSFAFEMVKAAVGDDDMRFERKRTRYSIDLLVRPVGDP